MLELHADDFGLFYDQSRRIARLVRAGAIDGVSVMVNTDDLTRSMKLLKHEKVCYTLHLNLVEGKALSRDVGLLTDGEGVFAPSFGKWLLYSYVPILRRRFVAQLKREISTQILVYRQHVPGPLRVDGHCHYHMLPAVFDALMEVTAEEGIPITEIRFPADKLKRYFTIRKIPKFSMINMVKTLVLQILSKRNLRKYGPRLASVKRQEFMGVAFSGAMTWANLGPVARRLVRSFGGSERDLEILFHPGRVVKGREIVRITDEGDLAFLTSEMRDLEGRAARRFAALKQES